MRAIILSFILLAAHLSVAQQSSSQVNEAAPKIGPDSTVLPVGVYSLPFSPVLSTPSAPAPTPALQVGAANATGDNIAGAHSAVISILPQQVLSAPRMVGASVAYDLYPKNGSQGQ